MSEPSKSVANAPLDLSKWRNAPRNLMVLGIALVVIGLVVTGHGAWKQFAYSWLLAFMFCLSLCGGALFLVIVHHLFDAGWSVAIRRFCEHIASLFFPCLAILFLPIAILAPKIYKWMSSNPQYDHALKAKQPMFTRPGFYVVAAVCFGVWWLLSNRL